MRLTQRRGIAALSLALVLVAGACAEDGSDPVADASPQGEELIVQAANYELVAGDASRFIAGLLTPDQLFVSFGTVDVEFFYLGTRDAEQEAEPGPVAAASFLAIEGEAPADGPVATTASEGRGVYAAEVTFDRAGFWGARVTADLEDGPLSGQAMFEVLEDNVYPAVGERAPKTENLTLESVESGDAPAEAVDSRARDGAEVPDPQLHDMTIADSIRRGEPALVVFSTPVYCVSRFCGPVTDMVAALKREFDDRANFIHVEVWREFENTVANKGAAEWIYRKEDLSEPWIYLIDEGGRIAARWDNVATRGEIEPLLRELPKID